MKFNQINEDIPPMADIAAMAAVAGLAAPVMMAMIKAAYKTGKGINAIRKIANRAGVKLADRVMGEQQLPATVAGLRTGVNFRKGAKASGPVSTATYDQEMDALKRSKTAKKPTKQIPMTGRTIGEELTDFNKDEPNKSTVAVPGYGTMNIDSLMKNVIDQTTQMLTQMKQGTQGFRNADYELNRNKVLTTKIAALVQALDDLQTIRKQGGARSRNIQQESTLMEVRYTIPKSKIEKMIRASAKKYGINPDVAVMVWKSEGFGSYQSQIKVGKDSKVKSVNGKEASWGPFQLYTGGGLGNDYENKYGVKLADDNTEEGIARQIDFALNNAVSSGRGWAPWYGPGNKYDDWDNFKGLPGGTDYTPPPSDAVPADAPATSNLTYQKLAKINGIPDPDFITPGTPLTFPDGSTYTVQPGDTLSGIVTTYNNNTAPEPEPYVPPATDRVEPEPLAPAPQPTRDEQGRLIVTKPAATRWIDKKSIDKAVKQAIAYEPKSQPAVPTQPVKQPVKTAQADIQKKADDDFLKKRLAQRNASSGIVMADEQPPLPIDVNKIFDNIQEFESRRYIEPEDADKMRRGVQSLTSGRQTINSEAILQFLTMVTR